MQRLERPRLEGSIAVRDGRRLSFAEFGPAHGTAVFWLHGTPGSRRQVPLEARRYAEERNVRIIGLDRPGIGTSTPHLYTNILDWTPDLGIIADTLGLETFRVIGLSGGGPYALAAGVAFPDRVPMVGVLGGVAPLLGPDATEGGLMTLARPTAWLFERARLPLSVTMTQLIKLVRPLADPIISGYAALQPIGDKRLLSRPEFRAMFVDDLINGTRFQMGAPFADIVLFTRDWGFTAADVTVPVRWWHGDSDHIVPHEHGIHMSERLPRAVFSTIPGESHLGGMGVAVEVLDALLAADYADDSQPTS